MAENDNTVKRYKKEIDSTRELAITKFAKELLEVRDSLELATDYIKKAHLLEEQDVESLKKHLL